MKKTKLQSGGLEAAVGKILDLRASRVRALASKVSRLKKRLAVLDSQKLKKTFKEII
jgi:hypothetical protein